ncbi:nuclease sbccd subunit d [Lucifera butyrica]|uniref:Nuclease SbcCD subunit D n=1 Tax=Lucifera butyrica TaxID=1351585 RepID=A0A498R6R6_9FIRM|nr:exonuclease SbcCD subunit D [Lucifera butyrica]VBB06600.1 nuclease sbccd subunit d [Lucifera butyrica]
MRILHTADWHLGKTMDGRDRQPEQEQFIDEICGIAEQEAVDLVLIAGDVFHTPNPGAAAEELFYFALDRLSNHGVRGVVVIAGNHDNPERLCAPSPLADRLGITLVGLPRDEIYPTSYTPAGRVKRIQCGPSWLELAMPSCDHSAVLAALPYPSEGRLRQLMSRTLAEEEMQQGYAAMVKAAMERLSANFRRDTINIALSHIFVRGCMECPESENQIQQVGGIYAVDASVFPATAQYIALGHLHRPQALGGAVPGRYAGSPLQYSFAETGQAKSVTLVDVVPGESAAVREILLTAGKPLVKWRATAGLEQVYRWVEEGRDAAAWIDLELSVTQPLTMDQIQTLRRIQPGFVTIRPVIHLTGEGVDKLNELRHLSAEQMFARFYERQTGGAVAEPGLIKLFLDLTGETESFDDPKEREEANETA